jgi:AcrR family transcriptional regulator
MIAAAMTTGTPPLLSAKHSATGPKARDRILAAAYDLFARHGIRAVGIDAIIEHSGVARMTLYRHFASKDDLVLAFLERREALWFIGWLQGEIERRAKKPIDRLLAIFDLFGEWFRSESFEGCSFINVMLETSDRASPIRRASVQYLQRLTEFIERLAADAGVSDTAGFARKWRLLMNGSIIAAAEGDLDAGRRAREVGSLILAAALALPRPDAPEPT